MTEFGYALSSEEHGPIERQTRRRGGVRVRDDLRPLPPADGRAGTEPFVWSVIGAISQATERLRLGTGVTCPTIRIHLAIVAQAAATSATMMPGRFFLGVGSGENLNEHVVGQGCRHLTSDWRCSTACEIWPNAALSGDLGYEVPLPLHFEQATEDVTPEAIADAIPCGPDPDRRLEEIRAYEKAGYTHIYLHHIGYDQEGSSASGLRSSRRSSDLIDA
jgi:Luciferase-like monooxygenase